MENTNYRSLQCNSLGQILKTKGIPHSNKRKEELVNLFESAEALNLQMYHLLMKMTISRHLLEDGQSKVKRTRIHGTVPS